MVFTVCRTTRVSCLRELIRRSSHAALVVYIIFFPGLHWHRAMFAMVTLRRQDEYRPHTSPTTNSRETQNVDTYVQPAR